MYVIDLCKIILKSKYKLIIYLHSYFKNLGANDLNIHDELNEMKDDERNKTLKISDFGASQSKIAKAIMDLREDCICHKCPTYNNCTRESKELLYCLVGSSDCPIHKRKCLCPIHCPIYKKYNFKNSFYCSLDKKNKDRMVYNKKVYRV